MNFFEKLLRRILEMCPFIILFSVICGFLGAYWAMAVYGDSMAEEYYRPVLISIFPALFLAWITNETFRSDMGERRNIRLGEFDRMMIYHRFGGGASSKKLRNAVIDMHMHNFNDALDALQEIEETEKDDARLSVIDFYIGRCYQLMGYPSNGARYFRQALDKGLKLNDTYLLTARCLTQNGSFDEAIEYYNILAERNAYFDFIYTDMGIAYLKKGDGEKALEYFTRSVDEGKNYAFALGGCSLACLQMKNLDESRKYYKRALMCNMDDINGFKIFYCNIAESVGLLDEIDPNMKIRAGRIGEADELIR